jgi:hypothetical protein
MHGVTRFVWRAMVSGSGMERIHDHAARIQAMRELLCEQCRGELRLTMNRA